MLLCPSRIGIRAAVVDDIAEELLLRLGPRLIPRSGVSAKLDGPQFQLFRCQLTMQFVPHAPP